MRKILFLSFTCLLGACATLKTSPEYIARGNGYLTDGKVEQAIASFNKALTLNPQNMQGYQARATAYLVKGDYAQAAQDFTTAINANPNNSNLYTGYASSVAAMGEYDKALEALALAQQVNPEKPEIYLSRGNVYYMQGKYELAVQDFTALLAVYPAAEIFNMRGAALLKLDRPDLAKADFMAARSGQYPDTLEEYATAQ